MNPLLRLGVRAVMRSAAGRTSPARAFCAQKIEHDKVAVAQIGREVFLIDYRLESTAFCTILCYWTLLLLC